MVSKLKKAWVVVASAFVVKSIMIIPLSNDIAAAVVQAPNSSKE